MDNEAIIAALQAALREEQAKSRHLLSLIEETSKKAAPPVFPLRALRQSHPQMGLVAGWWLFR